MTRTLLTARTTGLLASILGTGALATALAQPPGGDGDRPRRSPVQRPPQPPDGSMPPPGPGGPVRFPQDVRAIDGVGNNPVHPDWGSVGSRLVRMTATAYADGVGAPAGADRPGPREISNAVMAQSESRPNPVNASDFLWQWGQFLDHDITETPIADPGEAFDIPVPAGDPWFDPFETGTATIPLDRSAYAFAGGVRQQLNNITSFIDASNVYGADEERASALRAHDGTGRLATSAGDLLPYNVDGLDNAPTSEDPSYFVAGDIRANEQIGLTVMHTLFVREHNHHADRIRQENPQLTGDQVYEHARAIVAGEMQAITYREFLPILLGPGALPPYEGPCPEVNAGIANVFATAAYRVGHTMLSAQLLRLDASGAEIGSGHISLAGSFFNPGEIEEHGIDAVLRGLAAQTAQDVDVYIIDEVRNFLFGAPGSPGFDLASLNIQRGRDHGLPGYNQVRQDFGLDPVTSFAGITPDADVQVALAAVYPDVDEIDAWVGMLAEPHVPGALVGETLRVVLADQFRRLRDGDRFWYRSYLSPSMVQMIEEQTLARIIRRNTDVGGELADDVFVVAEAATCFADVDGTGTVDFGDVLAMLSSWGPCAGCPADVDGSGFVDFTDVLVVISNWGACP
ncbi:MAG: peroxiredoxin [Planctomycetes bacterium]|nr:peroxiredoxin [Planctomycetota bacterium]